MLTVREPLSFYLALITLQYELEIIYCTRKTTASSGHLQHRIQHTSRAPISTCATPFSYHPWIAPSQFLFRCLALGMDGVEGTQALHGYGAICADGTGLGKTLQSIAVMWQLMRCAAHDAVTSVTPFRSRKTSQAFDNPDVTYSIQPIIIQPNIHCSKPEHCKACTTCPIVSRS